MGWPLEWPKLKFEGWLLFPHEELLYNASFVEYDKHIFALNVGSGKEEDEPGFDIELIVVMNFMPIRFDDAIRCSQDTGDLRSRAHSLFDRGHITLLDIFTVRSPDKSTSLGQ